MDGLLSAALVLCLFTLLPIVVVTLAIFGIGRSVTTSIIIYLFMSCLVTST